MNEAKTKADTLVEAIKYIKTYEHKIVVIKYGGNAMTSDDFKRLVFEDIAMLWQLGLKIVLVHGGGPDIDRRMQEGGLQKKTVNGLRVTDAKTLEIVRTVLAEITQDCVTYLKAQKAKAQDCTNGVLLTKIKDEELGYVGDVSEVRTEKLVAALEQGIIPVVACIGQDESGQFTNINADIAATNIAIALNAEKLTILTNVDAVMGADHQKISHLSAAQAQKHINNGVINGGMIPKVLACIDAVDHGVKKAHLLNGTAPRTLLLEIFTDKGIGTEVVKS